mgnify:CR=1 FL=1
MADARICTRCRISEHDAMLAYRDGKLVCGDCDSALENEWVAEDPENNRHYLDTLNENWRGAS